MKSRSLVAVAFALATLEFGTHNSQGTSGATAFDGNWSVTLDAKEYRNPNGSVALAFIRRFTATVKNGVFHGEIGTRGKPQWYELSGKIQSDGTALLRANEITGDQKYNFTLSRNAPPGEGIGYSYQVTAHFNNRNGTGRSSDRRPKIFSFVRS